ncbi:MAG: helix-turn-helix domain-containing protein [Janthinobacterium lividum]
MQVRENSPSPTANIYSPCLGTPLLTSTEVMTLLRVNRATLCRYCRAGLIPHLRMPDFSYRFDPSALTIWIKERSIS